MCFSAVTENLCFSFPFTDGEFVFSHRAGVILNIPAWCEVTGIKQQTVTTALLLWLWRSWTIVALIVQMNERLKPFYRCRPGGCVELLPVCLETEKRHASLSEGNNACHPKWASHIHMTRAPCWESAWNLWHIWWEVEAVWCSRASGQRSHHIINTVSKKEHEAYEECFRPVKRCPAVEPAELEKKNTPWANRFNLPDWQPPQWRRPTLFTSNYLSR